MSFLKKISAYDSTLEAPQGSRGGQRSVGRSLTSYLRGDVMGRVMDSVARGRGDDNMVMGVACHLSSLSRSDRRDYLTRMSPVVRRKLLDVGVNLQRLVKDSAIDYAPQLCWAIGSVMEDGFGDGYQWLKEQAALPKEVAAWFNAYKQDPLSMATRRAASRLGRYQLVHDDDRLTEYMEGGSSQEDGLQDVVDESAALGADLTEGAADALAELHEAAKEKTSSFLSSLMSTYEQGISDVISQEVMDLAGAETEDLLSDVVDPDLDSVVQNEDGGLVSEDDLVDDPFDDDFGAGDVNGADDDVDDAGVSDAAPVRKKYVYRKSRPVKDCGVDVNVAPAVSAVDEVPPAPFAVGVPVQVSYMGNLYNGRVSAAGNGSIVVEGLPFEYFTARSAAGNFTGTMADMTFMEADVHPCVEEAVAEVEAVEVPAIIEEESAVVVPAAGPDEPTVLETAVPLTEDADVIAVEDGVAGKYDAARAAALADALGIEVTSVEYVDGEYVNMEDPNATSYLVLEEDELPAAGRFAGSADFESDAFYIYNSQTVPAVTSYEVRLEPVVEVGQSAVDVLADVGYRGIGKLVSQINNIEAGFYDVEAEVISLGDGKSYEGMVISHYPANAAQVDPTVLLVTGDDGVNSDYLYYKRLISPSLNDFTVVVPSPSATGASNDAMQYLVDYFAAYGGASVDDINMLKQSLRGELTSSVEDAAEPAPEAVSASALLDRVQEGEDLVSEDDAYGIIYDEGFFVFISPEGTESLVYAAAMPYLVEHRNEFGPALDVLIADETPVEDAVEDVSVESTALENGVEETRSSVTTMEDVDGEVVSSQEDVRTYTVDPAMWESMFTATKAWGAEWCFTLSQSVEDSVRLSAATALNNVMQTIGFDNVRVDATVPQVLLKDNPLAAFKVNGLYVGSTLFMYQTSDSGISAFSDSVASELVSLGRKIMDYTSVTSTVEVQDADDDSLLSETVKQEVLSQVEDKVKEALEKVGLAVEDSAPIVSSEGLSAGVPNTYDIPHTASTFHRVRDYGRVMDSVLSVASELLGERVSASQYRSMLKSGSKKCAAKVQKVVDTAIMMDALDLVCPTLYKERLTDSCWVCDSVADVEKVFKWKSGASGDARCVVSKDPIEGGDVVTVGKSQVYFKVL